MMPEIAPAYMHVIPGLRKVQTTLISLTEDEQRTEPVFNLLSQTQEISFALHKG